jgi:hypothetical protein
MRHKPRGYYRVPEVTRAGTFGFEFLLHHQEKTRSYGKDAN